MDIGDRMALVTGSGRGIGRGIATVLARNGANVVVADINQSDAVEAAAEISGLGRRSLGLRVDVTSQESVDAMVGEAIAEFGRVDILHNNAAALGNASVGADLAIEELEVELREVLQLSLWHGLHLREIAHVVGAGEGEIRDQATRGLLSIASQLRLAKSPPS